MFHDTHQLLRLNSKTHKIFINLSSSALNTLILSLDKFMLLFHPVWFSN